MNKRTTLLLIIIFVLLPLRAKGAVTLQEVALVSTFGSWNMRMIESIRNESKEINLRVKMLSSGDVDHFDMWHEELALFREDIRRRPPKAIILVGDESWIVFKDIIKDERFNIPIILCGVKEHTMMYENLVGLGDSVDLTHFMPIEESMKGVDAYAVIEPVEVKNVYHMMAKLNPKMKQLALLTRSKFYGSYVQYITKEFLEENYPNIQPIFYRSNDYTTQEMVDELRAMNPYTGVAISSWGLRRTDTLRTIENTHQLFAFYSPTPPFMVGYSKRSINHVMGGDFPNSQETASVTMKVLHQILSGGSIDQTVINPTKRKLYMNAEAMTLWGVTEDILPEDVVIYNKSSSFMQRYSNYLWITLLLITLIIIITIEEYRRQRRHQRDLEEKNALLEEAKESAELERQRAEEATMMKSVFLANMSHEIKTPLNAIIGFSNLMTNEYIDVNERASIVKIIEENSQILHSLISDLLDLSRIESGAVRMEIKSIDLNTLLDRCYFSQQINWNSKAIFKKELPNENILVDADEIRLQQVIHNLISNAQKHTTHGEVTLGYYMEDDSVTIFVRDTGDGIPKEHLGDIFNRFFKATTKIQGTGLGLTIAKSLVEKMSGEIWVESTQGLGSSFFVSIPLSCKKRSITQAEEELTVACCGA